MAISLEDLKAQLATSEDFTRAPIILMYGCEGAGKTTFAANAPMPIFIPAEDGFGQIASRIGNGIETFPKPDTFEQLMNYLTMLAEAPPHFKTLVLDTMDRVEKLIAEVVLRKHGKETLQNIAYGKGFMEVKLLWEEYLAAIQWINKNKNMMILQLAHMDIKAINLPDAPSYDEYVITLNKNAAALLKGQSDCIFFANYKPPHVVTEKSGFSETKKAVGESTRFLYLEKRTTSFGKNRYSLPSTIPFDDSSWNIIANHIKWFDQFKTENVPA